MQPRSNLLTVMVMAVVICLFGAVYGKPQTDHSDIQTHWSKAFDETGKQLKDFGSDVKDETTKFFDDVADPPNLTGTQQSKRSTTRARSSRSLAAMSKMDRPSSLTTSLATELILSLSISFHCWPW